MGVDKGRSGTVAHVCLAFGSDIGLGSFVGAYPKSQEFVCLR